MIRDGEVDADDDEVIPSSFSETCDRLNQIQFDVSVRPSSTGHIDNNLEGRPEDHGKLVRDILEIQKDQKAGVDDSGSLRIISALNSPTNTRP